MRSPIAAGYVSSPYGPRGRVFHAGMDLAPHSPGYGAPVYAAFAGIVTTVVAGRRAGQPATIGPVLAPGRSGNGVLIRNPDGEGQLYVHITPTVRTGQTVAEGQLIGHTDPSGIQTGEHVHYEEWSRWWDSGSHRNPAPTFTWHGITPGRTPTPTPQEDDDMPTPQEIAYAVWAYKPNPKHVAEPRDAYQIIRDADAAIRALPRETIRAAVADVIAGLTPATVDEQAIIDGITANLVNGLQITGTIKGA